MSETSFNNWVEWKEKCDLRKCTLETQTIILRYVHKRWLNLTGNAIHKAKVGRVMLRELDAWTCWDLFESHCADLQSRTHKVYKNYFFDAIRTSNNSPVHTIKALIYQPLRDALRKYVKDTYLPAFVDSLDADIARDDDAFTRLDVFVFPGQENPTLDAVTTREYHRIAVEVAKALFSELSHRLRVSFAANALDLPLSHPEVERLSGCKKSVLSESCRALILKLGSRLKAKYPQDDAERLTVLAFDCLKDMCCQWARTETSCAGLFLVVEARKVANA